MYIEVTESIFREAFQSTRPEQFTYAGLRALYEYLTDMGEDNDCELDVIAICCQYAESTPEDFCKQYGIDTDGLDENTMFDAAVEFAEENTTLVGTTVDGCLIYCTEF